MSHSQQVGARFCKFELSGESNIYVCPRDEYCCNIGCCISPTFQFYQLWYYWFMVFFMFLVCSGGQWWYRYVMQGRCTSAMPPPPRRASYPRQCRVAYTPARDTVVLHHLWKPTYNGVNTGPPPSYSQSGASGSASSGGPKPSPYMQLYGPPPSYESVIGTSPVPIHHLGSSSHQQDSTSNTSQTSFLRSPNGIEQNFQPTPGSSGEQELQMASGISNHQINVTRRSSQAHSLGDTRKLSFNEQPGRRRNSAQNLPYHQHPQQSTLDPNPNLSQSLHAEGQQNITQPLPDVNSFRSQQEEPLLKEGNVSHDNNELTSIHTPPSSTTTTSCSHNL